MPAACAGPGRTKPVSGMTSYRVFVGEHAGFEKHRALHFAPDEPLPQLGGLFPDVFNVALADGSVTTLSKKANPELLRLVIERDDGQPFDWARIKAPAGPREADLRRQNERLRGDLEQMRAQLEVLKREREVLQEEDAETLRLKKENEDLEKLLRQTREETERLRKEIQRLKQDRSKPKDE